MMKEIKKPKTPRKPPTLDLTTLKVFLVSVGRVSLTHSPERKA